MRQRARGVQMGVGIDGVACSAGFGREAWLGAGPVGHDGAAIGHGTTNCTGWGRGTLPEIFAVPMSSLRIDRACSP